ncbi:Rrf2 family transcriptional regulator [Clostridium sp. CX1]|uniref:Rrf2 family transcriptional regulator n=1 Tax=Clostridium tanneri TaxID=3037988 RepID=A0ABU4JPC1_9CLOT|nr:MULTISPECIES: Rrf2 family transcriptional regulator [unclassified Clostridium]MCT8977234.1 Rrf2 family transcriptional regulator [Clostridium sp. CX1]MDW8799980.1 Rrf2 family transcriptional regulator [Clostridium sp. A1-XYC3]
MKITQEADYAFRVVFYLSKLGYGEKIEAKVISEEENIPLRFLLKLLRKLTQANIIKSYRGVNGGYSLNQMPEDISLKDVIEAIDGPIYINRCLYNPEECNLNRTSRCQIHNALAKVQNKLVNELDGITFKDILEKKI